MHDNKGRLRNPCGIVLMVISGDMQQLNPTRASHSLPDILQEDVDKCIKRK